MASQNNGDAPADDNTFDVIQKRPIVQQSVRDAALPVEQAMRAAQDKLTERLPGLQVEYNGVLHVPEVVSLVGGASLTSADTSLASVNSASANEATLRSFVTENARLYGLNQTQAGQLTTVADYTNPAGNLSFVELQQEINGIPVFQGFVRGVLNKDGQLVRTNSLLASGLRASALTATPKLSAPEAVALGASKINVLMDAGSLIVMERGANDRVQVVSRGALAQNTKTELVYFPLAPGSAVLAYSMVLWQPDIAYYVLINAQTGDLLWRKNISADQTQPVTYNIYNNDSPSPLSPTTFTAPTTALPPGITRTDVTLVSENPTADQLGWIPDGAGNAVTTGNNVDAGIDVTAPDGIDTGGRATGTGRVFSFPYIPDGAADPTGSNLPTDANYRAGVVTNLFFWTNRYHDRLYDLGFTEAAHNFQTNNFGRGGVGNDPVSAQAQDSSSTNNANFNTPPDGSSGRMQMFIFTTAPVNRDGDVDADVFIHELTHGTSNRLHGNASGLFTTQAGGMGEGWSDYYARALLSSADEDVNGIFPMGGYVTKNYYYGIRRFPYAVKANVGPNGKPHSPLTFADVDPAQINLTDGAFAPSGGGPANEVHNIGEVWCMTLLEMRARLITALGYAAGNQRALQIVTDGMKLDPISPTMVQARDSILAANCAGSNGANELDIWEGFRLRGMGFRASTDGLNVVENFEGPNLIFGNVTTTEASGGGNNGNGSVDPGEAVTINLPLVNTLCATDAVGVTAQVAGGGSANYGTVVHGGNATQSLTFTVPTTAACGSVLPVTITVNSTTLGPINYIYNLPIGRPAPLSNFENFDGVSAPNLPAGWTSTHSGAGLFWQTTTNNPDTPSNSAFTPNRPNFGTSELVSPRIPVNTALGQLSFRNLYNLEDSFDGMTLQIKIGNGPFKDIITAGGSFVSGGYNGDIGSGRAWTGLSGGTTASPTYVTTVVNLPSAASGQLVQFRWQVSNDGSVTAEGQAGAQVDTIQLSTSVQPCSPFGVQTVSLSGRVTDSTANGVGGIQVTLGGTTNATTTTNGSGDYSFPNIVSGGSYTVTPTSPGYNYTPPSLTFNNLTTNVTNANFVAIPAPSISGRVATFNGAQGIDGVTVTLTGSASAAVVTSGGGFYTFGPLASGGNYTVTPTGRNSSFTPPSRTYNNLTGPITNADFAAAENLICSPLSPVINGSIAAGDLTQTDRLARDGVINTCNSTKAFPGPLTAGTIRYDKYTFPVTATSCVRITITANFAVHSVAYLDSYDPNNEGTNYLGDQGTSLAATGGTVNWSVNVPANHTLVIVVNETSSNTATTGGNNYTLTFGCGNDIVNAGPGQVLISEFRPSGATPSDEYIELYNNTDELISIGGYRLLTFSPAFGGDIGLTTIPANTTIPRRGHYLIVNSNASGYSLGSYAAANRGYTGGAGVDVIPDNQGVALYDASLTIPIDSVGFVGNGGGFQYVEGNGLPPVTSPRPAQQYAYVRRQPLSSVFPQDTGDNAADFVLVAVDPTTYGNNAVLGAPGPENTASPVERSIFDTPSLVDPNAPSSGGENRQRFITCGLPNAPACPPDPLTSTTGYLSIRRKFTNNSAVSVTRLRFRIIDLTTLGSPGGGPTSGQADLRAITSSNIIVTINGSPVTIQGTTLETPPTQANGGGINSSMSVTLGTPIPSGQSVNVQFMFGVKQGGSFRVAVATEALP
ncbi:MAG TPA: M36 family metallopeptidase [Pyrinomonadaceae bacterium]|jgi:hypothetical protein